MRTRSVIRVFALTLALSPLFLARGAAATPPSPADGFTDASFGTAGRVVHDGGGPDYVADVARAADDSLLVVGATRDELGASVIELTKVLPNGAPATSFGNQGTLVLPLFSGAGQIPAAIAVDRDGAIVIAGTTRFAGGRDRDIFVVRLDAQGVPDPSFNGGGYLGIPFDLGGDLVDEGKDVLIDPAGRIVVVGKAETATDEDFAVARILPNGLPDGTFGGGDGRLTIDSGAQLSDRAVAVVRTGDGDLLIAGTTEPVGGSPLAAETIEPPKFSVLSIDQAGAVRNEYGGAGNGWAVHGFVHQGQPTRSSVTAMAQRADGSVVVAGAIILPSGIVDFGVLLLDRAGLPVSDFGQQGRTLIAFGQGEELDGLAMGVMVQCDGRMVVTGSVETGGIPTTQFGSVRLRGDGTLDPSFGIGGASLVGVPGLRVTAAGGALWGGRAIAVGHVADEGVSELGGGTGSTTQPDVAILRLHAQLVSCTGFEGIDPTGGWSSFPPASN